MIHVLKMLLLCCLPKALMDILQQDRREAAEQRQELCDIITRIQGELQSSEEHRDKVVFLFLKSRFQMNELFSLVLHELSAFEWRL